MIYILYADVRAGRIGWLNLLIIISGLEGEGVLLLIGLGVWLFSLLNFALDVRNKKKVLGGLISSLDGVGIYTA